MSDLLQSFSINLSQYEQNKSLMWAWLNQITADLMQSNLMCLFSYHVMHINNVFLFTYYT